MGIRDSDVSALPQVQSVQLTGMYVHVCMSVLVSDLSNWN